jgi:hypothetical protein
MYHGIATKVNRKYILKIVKKFQGNGQVITGC